MLTVMSDETTQVQITLAGKLSYSDTISLSQAAQIIAFIDSSTLPSGFSSAPPPGSPLGGTTGSRNPREALDTSGAMTNPEKIVAFALHVSQEGGKGVFTLEDVKPLFRRARESTPRNLGRDLDTAIKAGWVAESNAKGEFYVTEKATRVLDTGFEEIRSGRVGARRPGTSGRRPRTSASPKRPRNTSTPDAFAGIDSIAPTIDGYVNYHKVDTKKDKLLWAVNAAKLVGVPSVTNQELVWLTDQLGEVITTKDIPAYYQRNQKDGYLNRSHQDNKIRILPKGEEYLKLMAEGKTK